MVDGDEPPFEEPENKYKCGVLIEKNDGYRRPPCNIRLEEISKPQKRLLYVNYNMFSRVLPKERVEDMAMILREELAMPAELVNFIVFSFCMYKMNRIVEITFCSSVLQKCTLFL